MITAKEAAHLVDHPNPYRTNEVHEFVLNSPARQLQFFSHLIATDTLDAREWKNRARMAVDIKISDETAKQAESLEKQIVELVGIAAEQKRLAAELDGVTKKLVGLTAWLKWLTVSLVFLTCLLCLLEFRRGENVQQIGLNPAQIAPHINQSINDAARNTNYQTLSNTDK